MTTIAFSELLQEAQNKTVMYLARDLHYLEVIVYVCRTIKNLDKGRQPWLFQL